jgi:hypothetical protein
MAVRVVKVDDVADGFDESVAGFVFCHDSMAIAGVEIFKNEPARKATD